MMECEVCYDWFHFSCIGYKGTIEEANKLDFKCKNCSTG